MFYDHMSLSHDMITLSSHAIYILSILYDLMFAIKCLNAVMLDSRLGNKSDIFHHNNENNQLERRVWPPRDVH